MQMDSIIRHTWVYSREKFGQAANEGDDVYLLEYGYCPRTQRYKRIDEIADDGRGWNYEVSVIGQFVEKLVIRLHEVHCQRDLEKGC